MKTSFFTILPLLFVSLMFIQVGCTSDLKNEQSSDTDVIKSGAVGVVHIGMSLEKFRKLPMLHKTVKKVTKNMEGDDYDFYNVYENEQLVYSVEPDAEKIWRIWIYGEKFKTEKGIGVGNSLGDIKKNYEIADFSGEEGQVTIMPKDFAGSFILKSTDIPESWWMNRKFEDLSENLKIEAIIL